LNQLQDLVFVLFPEFSTAIKDIQTKTAKYLIKHYPTPQDIIRLGVEELTLIMRRVSRGRFGQKQADAAKSSAGITEGVDSIVVSLKGVDLCLGNFFTLLL